MQWKKKSIKITQDINESNNNKIIKKKETTFKKKFYLFKL